MGKRAPQKTARFDEDTIAKVANFWVNQALEADVELWLEGLDGREIGEMSSTLTENGVLLRAALSKGMSSPSNPLCTLSCIFLVLRRRIATKQD